jgi:N-acetylmuramoyl-L-alanine amidase
MPAILVEVGFINSDTDNQLFDKNFDAVAQGIADGILDIFEEEGDTPKVYYRVQTGAYRNRAYAERLLAELLEQDYPAFIQESNGFYLVQVGSYTNMDEAVQMEKRLKRAGYPTLLLGA